MSHGNKYLFLVAALALAAPVLYQYGPDFTRDVEQVAAQKADIAAAVAATVINSQAAQPQVKSSPAAASLQVLKESTQESSKSGAKEVGSKSSTRSRVGSKDAAQDAPQKTRRRVERKSSAAPVRGKHTPDVVPTVSATHAAELENPRDKRWLKGLTGSRIRFGMERGARGDSCAKPGSCEPVGNSENVSVVGVVVDADKLERLPLGEGVIQGKVRQGHWSDNKPVVYMQ